MRWRHHPFCVSSLVLPLFLADETKQADSFRFGLRKHSLDFRTQRPVAKYGERPYLGIRSQLGVCLDQDPQSFVWNPSSQKKKSPPLARLSFATRHSGDHRQAGTAFPAGSFPCVPYEFGYIPPPVRGPYRPSPCQESRMQPPSSPIVDGIVGKFFFNLSLISKIFFSRFLLSLSYLEQNIEFLRVYSCPQ